MPTYTIEGKRIKTDAPLSDADIDEIAAGLKAKAPAVEEKPTKPSMGEALAAAYKMGGPYAGVTGKDYRTLVGTGLTDPIVAVRELTGTIAPEAVRQREAEYQAAAARTGEGAGFGRFMSGAVSTLPLMAVPGAPASMNFLGRVATGAGIGGATAALTQPTTGEGDFWRQKLAQAELGAEIGGSIPFIGAGLRGIGAGYSFVRNRLSPEVNAQNILAAAAGSPEQLARIQAANAAQPNVLASQAAAALPGTAQPYQAIVRRAEMEVPDIVAATRAAQTQGHLDTLQRLTGGATQAETQAARKGTKAALQAVTTPMREDALAAVQRRADIAREARATGKSLLIPQSPGPGLEAPKPLDIDAVIGRVESAADSPAIRVDKVQSGVLKNVADLIRDEVKRGDGVIDVDALYAIRKSAINAEIQKLLPNADAKSQQKYAAELLSKLKPAIDDAIEKAGGRGWKDYLRTYEQGMTQLNQQKLLGLAQDLYRTNKNAFVDLVEGNNTKPVQKIFGSEFDINTALGDKIKPLRQIADDIKREASINAQVTGGATRATRILQENLLNARIPNFLSPKITVANQAIQSLEGKVNAKTLRVLANAVQSGANMNELLAMVPPGERSKVSQALKAVGPVLEMPYVINALTPMSSRAPDQNALAR